MNTAPNPRDAGLVGGIEISGPLQLNRGAWALLEGQIGYGVTAHSTREKRRTCDCGQNLGGRTAKGAVTRDISRESRGDKNGFLVGNPIVGMNPGNSTVHRLRICRGSWPRVNGDFARRESRVASGSHRVGCNQLDEIC